MLYVTERQKTEQWYELGGNLKPAEVFPTLLAGKEDDEYLTEQFEEEHPEIELETESETVDGRYDGCPQELSQMRDEVKAVEAAAAKYFWPAAIEAATKMIHAAIQAGKPILQEHLKTGEIEALEEAAKALKTVVPWDAAEVEMLARRKAYIEAEHAKYEAEVKAQIEAQLAAESEYRALEPELTKLFRAGARHSEVRAKYPQLRNQISQLVGYLRQQGVSISK